ncbi:MAG: ABC transporter ATP-binding protein [Desulfobacteraceae bacterium]|nr:MAG: ABC transporter ATP-binding protein [Desulfobacteraceae bacterium]
MTDPIIESRRVWFAYNGDTVLEEINLQIARGDFVAVIGPNGGGKTTLLKVLLGLLEPSQGTVRVCGRPPREVSHRIGYVPQSSTIDLTFPITVLDVVLMGGLMPGAKWPRASRAQRSLALKVLSQTGVADLAARRFGDISGGQRQRVFIARALASEPQILFLDEPTAGIDAQGQIELYCLLEQLNAEMTIVMVSHDLLALSTHVKSVACVNRQLYYHDQPELTHAMMEIMYPHTPGEACPVELVAHGVPHRVLRKHKEE